MTWRYRIAVVSLLAVVTAGCSGTSSSSSDASGKRRDSPRETKSGDGAGIDALLKAEEEGQAGRVGQLLKEGANVNDRDASGETALMRASARGNLGVVKTLVDHNALMAEQDRGGQTALMKAARNGHRPVVLLLKDRHDEKVQSTTLYQLAALRDREGVRR